MPLSWNEIKTRAAAFIHEWKNETNEDAEAKSFWDEFFFIFDIKRRRIASFEYHVQKLNNASGYIDLFWPGTLIVEHKSKGKNLDKAYSQVLDYFHGIADKELPKYILVSDFTHFRLYDLDNNTQTEFPIHTLVDNIQLFGFIAGYQKKTYKEQDPVNIQAAELMGKLHDKLKAVGYTGHALEVYLVRLVFCLFADDSNIFEKGIFEDYIELQTKEDGSNLAMYLDTLFTVLNTHVQQRLKNLDENLAAFPYVNGKLFEERLHPASFDSAMRSTLLQCCTLDWSKISPAIFGSLFQSVMDEKARRNLGAHYTSEKNILKLIKPLFLDELWGDFEKIKNSKAQLQKLHEKISSLRFFDPACGCGNFLIIAYRELRLLEVAIIKRLLHLQGYREEVIREARMDASYLIQCNVDQFYGIEYEEFPAQIARTAMWLMDHQMNMLVTEIFGEYYVRLPLQKSAAIMHGNALRINWQTLINPLPFEKGEAKFDYILGNPPFVGKQYQNAEQKKDMDVVFHAVNGAGVLDYVTAWYIKAAQYMQSMNVFCDPAEGNADELPLRRTLVQQNIKQPAKAAFVSTNSITQGEQAGILWNELFNKYKIKIHFAHRTFKWGNEAKGNAAVHVVIIGFANFDTDEKRIFEYEDIRKEPHQIIVKNINPYLVEGKDILIKLRKRPLCNVQEMSNGSMPNDNGNLIFTTEEKKIILQNNPGIEKVIRKFVGAFEYLNNKERWCFWLLGINPSDLRRHIELMKRIEKVREFREKSSRETTRKLAKYPALFGEIRQPNIDYLIAPVVSSVNRKYIPISICSKNIIASNLVNIIPDPSKYVFGVLASEMMMCWIKTVGGKLKSDWRFTKDNVYNNFPWPESPTEKQKEAVEKAAQKLLDIRAAFPQSSLADLYDPNTMPPALVKSHNELDKAVDLCYRPQPFTGEAKRIEYLFELYDTYTAGLFVKEKKKKK